MAKKAAKGKAKVVESKPEPAPAGKVAPPTPLPPPSPPPPQKPLSPAPPPLVVDLAPADTDVPLPIPPPQPSYPQPHLTLVPGQEGSSNVAWPEINRFSGNEAGTAEVHHSPRGDNQEWGLGGGTFSLQVVLYKDYCSFVTHILRIEFLTFLRLASISSFYCSFICVRLHLTRCNNVRRHVSRRPGVSRRI